MEQKRKFHHNLHDKTIISKDMGPRITKIRTAVNMSVEDLAIELEMSPQQLEAIENGTELPSLQEMIIIGYIYDVTLEFLVFGREKNNLVTML